MSSVRAALGILCVMSLFIVGDIYVCCLFVFSSHVIPARICGQHRIYGCVVAGTHIARGGGSCRPCVRAGVTLRFTACLMSCAPTGARFEAIKIEKIWISGRKTAFFGEKWWCRPQRVCHPNADTWAKQASERMSSRCRIQASTGMSSQRTCPRENDIGG